MVLVEPLLVSRNVVVAVVALDATLAPARHHHALAVVVVVVWVELSRRQLRAVLEAARREHLAEGASVWIAPRPARDACEAHGTPVALAVAEDSAAGGRLDSIADVLGECPGDLADGLGRPVVRLGQWLDGGAHAALHGDVAVAVESDGTHARAGLELADAVVELGGHLCGRRARRVAVRSHDRDERLAHVGHGHRVVDLSQLVGEPALHLGAEPLERVGEAVDVGARNRLRASHSRRLPRPRRRRCSLRSPSWTRAPLRLAARASRSRSPRR